MAGAGKSAQCILYKFKLYNALTVIPNINRTLGPEYIPRGNYWRNDAQRFALCKRSLKRKLQIRSA